MIIMVRNKTNFPYVRVTRELVRIHDKGYLPKTANLSCWSCGKNNSENKQKHAKMEKKKICPFKFQIFNRDRQIKIKFVSSKHQVLLATTGYYLEHDYLNVHGIVVRAVWFNGRHRIFKKDIRNRFID